MADYAWFIQSFRHQRGCRVDECPVITFGGSYGGMLVAWFRQRYPQLTVGGVAAGAPVDFYPGDGREAAFWNATLHTFGSFGAPGCPGLVEDALHELRAKADSADG